ncbi:MAG: hypothetical protein VW338_00155 [Rhodospirillaceae bacterium]
MVLTFKIGFTLVVVGLVSSLFWLSVSAVSWTLSAIFGLMAVGGGLLAGCMLHAIWFPEEMEKKR